MEYRLLDVEKYRDHPCHIDYWSDGYYDVIASNDSFKLVYKSFKEPYHHKFDDRQDRLYQKWVSNARAFGAFDGDLLVGMIEVGVEEWSNRAFINHLKVEPVYRLKGIGKKLIDIAKAGAKKEGCRALILEVQSCNTKAIAFYKKMGFNFIGLDTIAYTNDDCKRHEVRLDMGILFDRDN